MDVQLRTEMSRTGLDEKNNNPDTKICAHCGIEKPLSEYHRHPIARKFRKPSCKPCAAIYGRKNWDRKLALAGKGRQVVVGGMVDSSSWKKGDVRSDGLVFYSKRNRKDGRFQEWWMTRENFEKRSEAQRARVRWRYRNDPVYREKERQENMSERHRAAKRRWNKANRIYMDEYLAARRAKIRGYELKLTAEERKRACEFYVFRDILNRVHGRAVFEVDHVKPISRGGLHHPDNLRVTTAIFNHRKHTNQLFPATHQKIA